MGGIVSKPKIPGANPDVQRQQQEQANAAAAREQQLKEEQSAELEDLRRRRRGSRSLLADYAPQFNTSLG